MMLMLILDFFTFSDFETFKKEKLNFMLNGFMTFLSVSSSFSWYKKVINL